MKYLLTVVEQNFVSLCDHVISPILTKLGLHVVVHVIWHEALKCSFRIKVSERNSFVFWGVFSINRDHRARLVSSNRENFRILTVRRYDTFLYAGDIRVPPRAGTLRGQKCNGQEIVSFVAVFRVVAQRSSLHVQTASFVVSFSIVNRSIAWRPWKRLLAHPTPQTLAALFFFHNNF